VLYINSLEKQIIKQKIPAHIFINSDYKAYQLLPDEERQDFEDVRISYHSPYFSSHSLRFFILNTNFLCLIIPPISWTCILICTKMKYIRRIFVCYSF
jgi:hypothetical protein